MAEDPESSCVTISVLFFEKGLCKATCFSSMGTAWYGSLLASVGNFHVEDNLDEQHQLNPV